MKKIPTAAAALLVSLSLSAHATTREDAEAFTQEVLKQESRIGSVMFDATRGILWAQSGVWSTGSGFSGSGRPNFEKLCGVAASNRVNLRFIIDSGVYPPSRAEHDEAVKRGEDYLSRIALVDCQRVRKSV